MSFNKIALIAVISFYTYSQVFSLDSIIESNDTVKTVALYSSTSVGKLKASK